MATGAGQGISAIAGAAEAKAEGKATKKPKPPVPTLPPGPLVPYELEDAISPPPAIPEPEPESFNSPSRLSDYSDFYSSRHVQALVDGAIAYLHFFAAENPRDPANPVKMATPQLIFVDGSFAELAQEMADYMQVGEQVKPLLDQEQNEEALQALVNASHFLNSAPEKDFTGAYNLLIHLVLQSQDPKKYLPTVCGNLLKPITSSPAHGFTLAANALSTIFNLLEHNNPLRYNVFLQIIRFIRQHGQFDLLKPRLKNLDDWFAEWNTDEKSQRRLYVEVSDAAGEAGDDE